MKYCYSIDVLDNQAKHIKTLTGEVEADRYSHACTRAWPLIEAEYDKIKSTAQYQVGVGSLHVERKEAQ